MLTDEALSVQKEYRSSKCEKGDLRHDPMRHIAEIGAALDQIVYQLYELTKKEIKLVEENNR